MRLALGWLAGIATTLAVMAIWKPTLGWALSRGDS